jgi:hypothetical protein
MEYTFLSGYLIIRSLNNVLVILISKVTVSIEFL